MLAERLGLTTQIPGWPLALFRIAYGLLYLDLALQKAPWVGYGWLRGFIEQGTASPAFGSYAAFLREVVLPNFALQAFLIELALGVALLLGEPALRRRSDAGATRTRLLSRAA